MDPTMCSELIGRCFRYTLGEKAEHNVQSLRDGIGTCVADPFTGETHRRKAAALAAILGERGLNKDREFMATLAAAATEIAEAPIRSLRQELNAYQQHGDGGPDRGFMLAAPSGQPVQMDAVLRGFDQK